MCSAITSGDPELFVRGGPTLTTFVVVFFYLFIFRESIQTITTINGPLSACQKKSHFIGVSLTCDDGWLGSFVVFQGIGINFGKKPYISVIFQEGLDPLSPPLGPPMYSSLLF